MNLPPLALTASSVPEALPAAASLAAGAFIRNEMSAHQDCTAHCGATDCQAPTVREYAVRFALRLPDGVRADEAEVRRWVEFQLHATGCLRVDNPLIDYDIEACNVCVYPVWR